jgi:hypothetical protein
VHSSFDIPIHHPFRENDVDGRARAAPHAEAPRQIRRGRRAHPCHVPRSFNWAAPGAPPAGPSSLTRVPSHHVVCSLSPRRPSAQLSSAEFELETRATHANAATSLGSLRQPAAPAIARCCLILLRGGGGGGAAGKG